MDLFPTINPQDSQPLGQGLFPTLDQPSQPVNLYTPRPFQQNLTQPGEQGIKPLQLFPTVDQPSQTKELFPTVAPATTKPKLEMPMPKQEPFQKEKTVGGFAKNFIDDASDTLKNLGHFLFVDLPQATVINPVRAGVGSTFDINADKTWREKYLKDWSDRIDRWSKDPAGQAAEGGGLLLHALADPYYDFNKGEAKWDFWYDRPFAVLADAATIASFGAGAAGKAANIAGRATRIGSGLARSAEILGNAEKVLNPIGWLQKGAGAVASPVLESFGIGKYSPALTKIVSETRAEAAAERGALEGVSAQERAAASTLQEVKPVPGGINTEALQEVKPTPVGPLTPDEAADLLQQAQDKVKRRLQIKGNIADIESGKLPDTPVMDARVADTFTDLKWRKVAFDRINQYLVDNKVISQVQVLGFEPINLKGLSKAYDVTLGTINEFNKARTAALKAGATEGEAIKAGSEASAAWGATLKDNSFGKDVWVPKHVANYLKHEFSPPDLGALTSMYKYWSPAVTSLKFPAYHLQVLVGNTVMSLLYGVNPLTEWGLTKKLRASGAFPAELAENTGARLMEEWSNGEGAFNKIGNAYQNAVKKIGEFGGVAGSDARLRQEIAVHYLSKQLKAGVLGSVPTHEALQAALTEILNSKQALREVLDDVKRARLTEAEAGTVASETASNLTGEARPPSKRAPKGREPYNIREGIEAPGPRGPKPLEEIRPVEGGITTPDLTEVEGVPVKSRPSRAPGPGGVRQATHIVGEEQYAKDLEYLKRRQQITSNLEGRIPDLQAKVDLLDKAIEEGNRWAGNVMALHPFERSILKKIVPFYSYTKAMTGLAFSAAILYPKRMFMLNRLAALTADIMHDKDAPEWVQEYVPFGFDSQGNIMAFRLGSLNPFSGVRGEEFGDLPVPGIIDPTRNPMVKLVYEAAGGTPHWTKKPMSPGDYAVRYGDGSVYEYQKDGTFKKTVPQPSLLRTVLYQFPQIQAITELSEPYVVDDRGKPILGPDGKPKFPRELWTRILALGGLRGSTYNEGDIKQQMLKKSVGIMNEFRKELRNPSLTPEERSNLVDMLKDAANAQHKRVENQ